MRLLDHAARSRLPIPLALASLALVGCGIAENQSAEAVSGRATLAYVVDGDTLRVRLPSGALEYVRLVGIDTPEDVKPGEPVECGALAAAASLRRLAPKGSAVTLRADSRADSRDRFGRILAHVYIGTRQLELAQLRRGWAEVYRFEGQRFDGLSRFQAAGRAARRATRGVWAACGGDFHAPPTGGR